MRDWSGRRRRLLASWLRQTSPQDGDPEKQNRCSGNCKAGACAP
jgi:hypothetical protein